VGGLALTLEGSKCVMNLFRIARRENIPAMVTYAEATQNVKDTVTSTANR